MKKSDLMNHVGKDVVIVLFDDSTICGKLGYIDEFSEKYDYRKPKNFYIGNMSFKVSHVKKLLENEG